MSNFKGYLLKFTKNNKTFPTEFIALNNYESTPLQRSEINAYRDSNNLLHRVTSPNKKTKIEFTTIELTLGQMEKIQTIFNGAYSNSDQRKLNVEYWDDELLTYRTMTAYMPDPKYKYKKITSDNIIYQPLSMTLIEY